MAVVELPDPILAAGVGRDRTRRPWRGGAAPADSADVHLPRRPLHPQHLADRRRDPGGDTAARQGQKMKGIARVYDHVTPAMVNQVWRNAGCGRWPRCTRVSGRSWCPGSRTCGPGGRSGRGRGPSPDRRRLTAESPAPPGRDRASDLRKRVVRDTGIEPVTSSVSGKCGGWIDQVKRIPAQVVHPNSFPRGRLQCRCFRSPSPNDRQTSSAPDAQRLASTVPNPGPARRRPAQADRRPTSPSR